MKNYSVSPARRAAFVAAGVLSLGAMCGPALGPALMSPVQAAPMAKNVLEIWPGQRVLLILPLTVGPDWNGGAELGRATTALVRPDLQQALAQTGKFSTTSPYRFDPILRRAVVESRLSDDVVTPFVDAPSLETAAPVFAQLKFDQVPMATQVQLEELRVGGTENRPTLQMQVSAKLYEIGAEGGTQTRSIVVTSDAVEGRTPEDRLRNAAANAFTQIADYFVKAPDSFQLPASLMPQMDAATPAKNGGKAMKNGNSNGANSNSAGSDQSAMAPKTTPPTAPPPTATPRIGAGADIPVLPTGTPPLGIEAGNEKTLGR